MTVAALPDAHAAIADAVDGAADELVRISRAIHANPETRFSEHQAAALLTEALERHGCEVERGVADMDTAFLGWLRGQQAHPCVGLVCEYDALPGLGHGCGHNLIGTAAVAAIVGLQAVRERLGGTVVVMGSPAEEGGGGKIYLYERGALKDVDLVLGVHPRGGKNFVATRPGTGSSLARSVLVLEFRGRAAHAAVNPQDGINALDALVQTYTGIGVMRQQLRTDARIHGIITHGGDAPNIIPAYAAARYYVRARDREYLAELEHRVRRIAEGAALQAGATVEISNPEPTYEDTRPNLTLGRAFRRNMEGLGLRVEDDDPQAGSSSTDFGNLSQRLPGVSAKFSISGERRVPGHSEALREAAGSDEGQQAMLTIAKAYAMTAFDVLSQPALVAEAQREFATSPAAR
jgi:amidohydrolase